MMQKYQGLIKWNVILLLLFAAVNTKGADITEIQAQLTAHKNELYYPNSVAQFYKQSGYRLAWIAPDTVSTHVWDAMLMLDCVIQYGLDHSDYHPNQLSYTLLHELIKQPGRANSQKTALYDIMLTDAVIAFTNNLHYGRINPEWPAWKIDKKGIKNFRAETVLADALTQKDFYGAIISIQPELASYKSLQYKMHIVTGLHTGDCYVTPESEIRLMAVNLERMRWLHVGRSNFITINIPSKILSYYKGGAVYRFKISSKINIGLQANFNEFSSRNGIITLRHASNPVIIPVEGMPLITNDFVNVHDDGKLAALLLGRTVNTRSKRVFKISKLVPVYITYYTCEIQDGYLKTYKDISHQDAGFERALYHNKIL